MMTGFPTGGIAQGDVCSGRAQETGTVPGTQFHPPPAIAG